MKKKFQVFVSSTYSDLIHERQAAVEAILRAGHIPAGMELFSAGSESQLEIIKRWIDDSDIYMLLLGGRYGSLEPSGEYSYTEIEYRYALEKDKPVFALIMDENAVEEKVKQNGSAAIETNNPTKFSIFKTLVKSKICRFFKDFNEIKLGVLESLLDIQSRYQISGWVRSDEMPDVTSLLQELNQLREENKKLEAQKRSNEAVDDPEIGNYTYSRLKTMLQNEKIDVPAQLMGQYGTVISVLDIFVKLFAAFISGINPYANSDRATITFFESFVPSLVAYKIIERIGSSFKTTAYGNRFMAAYKNEQYGIDEN
jgi:hypothetical protein